MAYSVLLQICDFRLIFPGSGSAKAFRKELMRRYTNYFMADKQAGRIDFRGEEGAEKTNKGRSSKPLRPKKLT